MQEQVAGEISKAAAKPIASAIRDEAEKKCCGIKWKHPLTWAYIVNFIAGSSIISSAFTIQCVSAGPTTLGFFGGLFILFLSFWGCCIYGCLQKKHTGQGCFDCFNKVFMHPLGMMGTCFVVSIVNIAVVSVPGVRRANGGIPSNCDAGFYVANVIAFIAGGFFLAGYIVVAKSGMAYNAKGSKGGWDQKYVKDKKNQKNQKNQKEENKFDDSNNAFSNPTEPIRQESFREPTQSNRAVDNDNPFSSGFNGGSSSNEASRNVDNDGRSDSNPFENSDNPFANDVV